MGAVTGARRLIGSVGLQPSEFAKMVTALYLTRYLGGMAERELSLRQIATAIGIAAAPMLLIALEPDLGGAAMFVPMLAGMLLVAGVRVRFLVTALVAALAFGVLVWSFGMQDYQRQRVVTVLQTASDPLGAGYQVRQSKIAVGSGELAGKGYMQGTQSQLRFLPARHTDFILAVLAEEWGFVGVATVLALYAVYLANAGAVAARARDRQGILLVTGLASVVLLSAPFGAGSVCPCLPGGSP